jgi:hypothetical protein
MIPEMHVGQCIRLGVCRCSCIDLLDVLCEHAFRPGNQVVPDLGALLERPETIHLDGRKVREDIASALIRLDEAKPLGIVEPLDSACGHTASPTLVCCHFRSAGQTCQVLRRIKMIAKCG